MPQSSMMTTPDFDIEQEYRAIEAALLGSTTGRWFLAEHGRRSRRLDSRVLEDAIGKLQSSLRQPPALLGQLQSEIGELRLYLAQTREELTNRRTEQPGSSTPASAMSAIQSAAEDMHKLVWSLQTKEADPVACEAIAKHASLIYAMSLQQARSSERIIALAASLDQAGGRLAALLETISHELRVDDDEPGPVRQPIAPAEPEAANAAIPAPSKPPASHSQPTPLMPFSSLDSSALPLPSSDDNSDSARATPYKPPEIE